jgi:DNA-binding beta-propeller fold protein YncE
LNTSNTYKPRVPLGVAAAVLLFAQAGCGFGESGIAPPSDRIFFPAGIAVDPGGQWLYVVNSNSDLRFNAGTVVAVNLVEAAKDRAAAQDPKTPRCPNSVFVQPESGAPRFCCRDFVDSNIVNCDDRGYVNSAATVRIGSFGGAVVVQPFQQNTTQRRLFVAVRAEPSITFIDATVTPAGVSLRCTPPGSSTDDPFCTDDFRIKSTPLPDGTELTLQEEPHPMLLDGALGVLYVGHLGGAVQGTLVARGVSVIDVCNPDNQRPQLASVLADALPRTGSIGVTSLTAQRLGQADQPLLATGELTADIAELFFVAPEMAMKCPPPEQNPKPLRNLTLAAGNRFSSSAFGTRGADLRGLVVDDQLERAWVLHRQYAARAEYNPPAVVALDRRPDEHNLPLNQPMAVVEVCNGPNRMVEHDAGRGPRLFVNCFENGQIYVIEPDQLTVEAIIELGAGPIDFVFAENDPSIAYVAGFANNNVSVLDLKPGSPTEYRVVQRIGFPRTMAVPK